ncbi:MAG: 2OG-Fe dioxygenase family protein [Deltaproteobacteria bacterium]|nr:2OG-Fe dioxygenase family protein [Deltaproteobacteria bacterium]
MVRPDQPPRPIALSDFLYESVDATAVLDVKALAAAYATIPVDPYIAEGYRYKAIAWLRIKHRLGTINKAIDEHIARASELSGLDPRAHLSDASPTWSDESGYECWKLPQYSLAQSKAYNPVHGDLRREYPPIARALLDGPDLRRLVFHYAARFEWHDALVLVQFQRVEALADRPGRVAVEGFHQDGNQHVAMLIVDRTNIAPDSGISQYKRDVGGKMTNEMVFDAVVPPGHLIYWNDKRVWHYGTDIEIADPGANGGRGTRDIVILSAKEPPAHVPMAPVPDRYKD